MTVSIAPVTLSPYHQRARGTGRLATQLIDGKTRIREFYQEGCAKIRLPHTHAVSLEGVLINTAGGLTGDDDVAWHIDASPGARLVLTTQACERVYRSLGDDAKVATHIRAGAGARVDWLPQETILYDGSRLARRLEVDLADDACFLGLEAILLGREAMGEAGRTASLTDNWRIRRNGRLIHAEATKLAGEDLARDGLGLLAGAGAFATLLYLGPDAEQKLARVRPMLSEQSGASQMGDRLVIRAIAQSGLALRRVIAPIIAELSGAGSLPRLWHL